MAAGGRDLAHNTIFVSVDLVITNRAAQIQILYEPLYSYWFQNSNIYSTMCSKQTVPILLFTAEDTICNISLCTRKSAQVS